jgi:hypothetical protein
MLYYSFLFVYLCSYWFVKNSFYYLS